MPSSATITTTDFVTFVANTRAKASEANGNFNIYRGHIIPVDPNTSAATDISYDLGSEEHRWRTTYSNKVDLLLTTTANLILTGRTSGELEIGIEGFTIGLWQQSQFNVFCTATGSATSGSMTLSPNLFRTTHANINTLDIGLQSFAIDLTSTSAATNCSLTFTPDKFQVLIGSNTAFEMIDTQYDFIIAGATKTSIDVGGIKPYLSNTTSSGITSVSNSNTTAVTVPGSTTSVSKTQANNGVLIYMIPPASASSITGIAVKKSLSAGVIDAEVNIRRVSNGITTTVYAYRFKTYGGSSAFVTNHIPPFVEYFQTTGSVIYDWAIRTHGSGDEIQMRRCSVHLMEFIG